MSKAKQRLRDKGIAANEVSASRLMHVPHTDLWMAPKGHPMHDPRSLDAVDEAMAVDMATRVQEARCPNTNAILVKETPTGLLVGDGHGRTAALFRAAAILGSKEPLMPLVEFFTGTDAELLLERMRRNDHGRFARGDGIEVLAFRVKQLTAAGVEMADILAACPRGVGAREVDALGRYGSLTKEARARFNGGTPIGLLAAVVDVAESEQVALIDKLEAAGAKTSRQATRAVNKAKAKPDPWARPMSPKMVERVAVALSELKGGHTFTRAAALVAASLRIAAGVQAEEALSNQLPAAIADAIRAARMGAK